MAELDDGWLPQSETSGNIEVDKLDFAYVESCRDWKVLFQILRALRSGKEGFFPDLEKTTELKLLQVMPEKIKKRYLAVMSSASPSQIAEAESDLSSWLHSATKLDIEIKNGSKHHSSVPEEVDLHWPTFQKMNKNQANKILDVRKELCVQEMTPLQRERKAEIEKRKGNESFKAFEYDRALSHYTKSLALCDNNATVWANRAMAYIKLDVFDLAEIDCTISLLLDNSYKKARSRRGLVRFKQGKYREAAEDFQEVLGQGGEGEKEAKQMLEKAMEKFKEVEGYDLILHYRSSSENEEKKAGVEILSKCNTSSEIATSMTRVQVPEEEKSYSSLFLPTQPVAVVVDRGVVVRGAQSEDRNSDTNEGNFVRIQIESDSDEEDDEEEEDSGEGIDSVESIPINTKAVADGNSDDDAAYNDALLSRITSPSLKEQVRGIVEEGKAEKGSAAVKLKDLGNSLVKEGQESAAVQVYTVSLTLDFNGVTLNNRAQAKLNLKDFQGAVEDCNLVLDQDANNAKALFRRAKAFLALQRWKTAMDDINRLLLTDPQSSTAVQLRNEALNMCLSESEELKGQGNLFMEQGKLREALNSYSQAIALFPQNYAACNNRALAFLKVKEYARAEEDCTVVIENKASPSLVQKALFRRAEARYHMLNPEAALDDLSRLEDQKSSAVVNLLKLAQEKISEQQKANLPSPPPAKNGVSSIPAPDSSKDKEQNLSPQKPQNKAIKAKSYETKTLEAIKKVKLTVPSELPKTLYEFERVWRSLAVDPSLQVSYLSSFKPSTFKKVFKESVATELLGGVFSVLHNHCEDLKVDESILLGLGGTKNFYFSITMLTKDDTDMLRSLVERIIARPDVCTQADEIKRIYSDVMK